MDRRELLGLGVSIGALAATTRVIATEQGGPYERCFEALDQYVAQYLREMNAPGLTLSLADANGVQRVCSYGLEDLERRTPLNADRLFHIGSISKSFVALCLLQLRDEGRFDLHHPIREYLPWLRFDAYDQPLTAHDLMTHAAALPDGPLFPPDPAFRYRATASPGSCFHYCNMGWAALGLLVEQIEGRPLAASLRERLFKPLGMDDTEGALSLELSGRLATSYQAAWSDRPFPRNGALVRSAPLASTQASDCIASTARDMGRYLQLLANRGELRRGEPAHGATGQRLVSPAGFALFTQPHIAADEFGPGSSYGYAVAVDQLDGHQRIKHTGGMVSYASALQVDLDAGVGAFASINAMQGYRPTPVTEYALRLMRACRESAPLPAPPPAASARSIANAADYAGTYTGGAGRQLKVYAEGDRLYLEHRGARVPIEAALDPDHAFIVRHDDFALYALLFTRGGADGKGPVTEAGWGEAWYAAPGYQGPREFATPPEWSRYVGHYRNEDPWIGSVRIVQRRGRLWVNGVTPLEPAGGSRFYLRDEPTSPEWVEFTDLVNGRAMQLYFSGNVLPRV